MEGLAVAASISDVIGLAGLCWAGTQILRSMYQEISSASKTVAKFTKDINNLMRTINDVQTVLIRVASANACDIPEVELATVRLHLEDCNACIEGWITTARKYRPTDGSGCKKWFKSFWTVLNKEDLSNVSKEIGRQRAELLVALTVLGIAFDAQVAKDTSGIQAGVLESNDLLRALSDRARLRDEALQRVEALSESIATISVASMRSLDSVQSHQSSLGSSLGRSRPDVVTFNRPCRSSSDARSDKSFRTARTSPRATEHEGLVEELEQALRAIDERHSERASNHGTKSATASQESEDIEDRRLVIAARARLPFDREKQVTWLSQPVSEDDMLEPEGLVMSSWDTSLLGTWTDTRDRIDRWILHSLGTDRWQATVHEGFLRSAGITCSDDRFRGDWSRLVVKYWFCEDQRADGASASHKVTDHSSLVGPTEGSFTKAHESGGAAAERDALPPLVFDSSSSSEGGFIFRRKTRSVPDLVPRWRKPDW